MTQEVIHPPAPQRLNCAFGSLPPVVLSVLGTYRLKVGPHAIQAARNDKLGDAIIPDILEIRAEDIRECELEYGQVSKVLVRFPQDNRLDLCLVLTNFNLSEGTVFVKTVWLRRAGSDPALVVTKDLYARF